MENKADNIDPTEMESHMPSTSVKQIKIWSNTETNQLLSLYKSLISEVGKRFANQKEMWFEISTHFPNMTTQQCLSRLRTVFKRKKKGIKKVYITKAKRNTNHLETKGDEFGIVRIHNMEFKPDDIPSHVKNIQVWSSSETKQLMELYKSLICDVGPQKRFSQKKEMWSEISTHFANKDPKQCETRFTHILNKQRKGYNAFSIQYIRGNTVRSKNRKTYKSITNDREVNEYENNERNTQEKKLLAATELKEKPIQETLLELAAKKEEANERRHRENMEVYKNMKHVLQQILVSKK
ncbi:uncharacterized protein LOC135957552 [Calliphora vicina]|uniref:uncharacterized protein LOC135957552 n=1 Tax=Calliphora vicina TaxID=7373 RepID=UPI00325B2F25